MNAELSLLRSFISVSLRRTHPSTTGVDSSLLPFSSDETVVVLSKGWMERQRLQYRRRQTDSLTVNPWAHPL